MRYSDVRFRVRHHYLEEPAYGGFFAFWAPRDFLSFCQQRLLPHLITTLKPFTGTTMVLQKI